MKSNEDLQAALIAYLKAQATLTSRLSDTHEIREDQWQGTNFSYPCYRVDLGSQRPELTHDCPSTLTGSVLAYSEQASSQQADDMAGAVAAVLHQKSFTRSGIRFAGIRVTDIVSAIRQDTYTWRSQVVFIALIE